MEFLMSKDYIQKGYKIVDRNKYFRKLNKIYNQIPNTSCLECGKCCVENPEGCFIEFLNFLNKFKVLPNKKELIEKVVENVMTSLVRKNTCSFLDGNRCLIYDVRPFSCRIFGIQSKSAFDKNFTNIESINKELSSKLKKMYDVNVIELGKMDYCNEVKVIGKRKINDNDIENLLKELIANEMKFRLKRFPLNNTFHSYEMYIAYLVEEELKINNEDWKKLRIKISKEISKENESETLNKFIKSINKHNF